MSNKDILFIADVWNSLDHQRDSTLHLARVAMKNFNLNCFYAGADDVYYDHGALQVHTIGHLNNNLPKSMLEQQRTVRPIQSFHSVHWRVDPPVDLKVMRLWSLILSLPPNEDTRWVNSPQSLLNWNEKFSALRFQPWCIPSLISNSEHAWKSFIKEHHGKKLIVKPAANAASRGVQILPASQNEALKVMFDLTHAHGPWLVIQELDESIILNGETRIFLINGTPCGAINKKPKPQRPIMNFDAIEENRPTVSIVSATPEQEKRARQIGSVLAHEGAYIATVDFIGDKVLEINVTSPGLLLWYDEQLKGKELSLADRYWQGLL